MSYARHDKILLVEDKWLLFILLYILIQWLANYILIYSGLFLFSEIKEMNCNLFGNIHIKKHSSHLLYRALTSDYRSLMYTY